MEDAEPIMNGPNASPSSAVRRGLAWAVFVTTCAIWAAALLLEWLTRGASSGDDLGPYDIVGLVVVMLLLAFPATGFVIATRRPATPIGWLLLAVGLGWGVLLASEGYAHYGLLAHPGSLPGADVVAAVGGAVWAAPVTLMRMTSVNAGTTSSVRTAEAIISGSAYRTRDATRRSETRTSVYFQRRPAPASCCA